MRLIVPQLKILISSILVLIGHLFPNRRIPVLLYHSVDTSGSVISITPTEFRAHMKYLKKQGYQTITLNTFAEYVRMSKKPPSKSVVITFDDGFKNNFSEAFPIIRQYGFTATIFLVTNHVGGVFSWDGHTSIPQMPLLSWEEIEEMSKFGIDFEAHTCSHPYLTQIAKDKQKTEMLKSKLLIEDKLNRPVRFFCHPYGDTNKQTQHMAKECGYVGAFGGLDFSLRNTNENLYDLTRVGTAHFSSLQDFKAGLLGTYDWYIKMKGLFLKNE